MIIQNQYNQIQNTSLDMMNSGRKHTLHPVNSLYKRIGQISEKIVDAEDIFERKHRLIQENIESIYQKVEDDKKMQDELK